MKTLFKRVGGIAIAVLLTLTLALPVMANPEDTTLWVRGFGFHCNHDGNNGITYVYVNGELREGNNVGTHNVGSVDFPITLNRVGTTNYWSLKTDAVVCATCGSTEWISFSNQDGIPNGSNIRAQHPEADPCDGGGNGGCDNNGGGDNGGGDGGDNGGGDNGGTTPEPVRQIWSQARVNGTDSQYADPVPDLKIVDRVWYEGVVPGQSYAMRGILMDRITGDELIVDGSTVTASKYFTPTSSAGYIDVDFFLDGTGLDGRTVVIFEFLYTQELPNGNLEAFAEFLAYAHGDVTEWVRVANDDDLNNDQQTVWFNTLTTYPIECCDDDDCDIYVPVGGCDDDCDIYVPVGGCDDDCDDYEPQGGGDDADDDEEDEEDNTRTEASPQTGDDFNGRAWLLLTIGSGIVACILAVVKLQRRRI